MKKGVKDMKKPAKKGRKCKYIEGTEFDRLECRLPLEMKLKFLDMAEKEGRTINGYLMVLLRNEIARVEQSRLINATN